MQCTERTIKSVEDQVNFDFLVGMAARMDVSAHCYGDYRGNYRGQYTPEFLRALEKTLRPFIKEWKGKGTTANGNAIMFSLERTLLYACGGETRSGWVPAGNTEYLEDSSNGNMIEFTCPQVPGAKFQATDTDKSPGFSGLSNKEIKEFKEEHPDE